MKKIITALLLLCICSTLFVGCASISAQTAPSPTDSSWQSVKSEKKLTIGIEENFAPMTSISKEGTPVGFGIDIAKEVCRRLGIEPEFVPVTWPQAKEDLADGKVDCLWTCYDKASVQSSLSSTHSFGYMQSSQVILCLKESKTSNLADLKGQRIGVKDSSSGQYALEASSTFRSSLAGVSVYEDFEKAKMALDNKKISAVVMDLACAQFYQSQQPELYSVLMKDDGNTPEVLATDNYCVAFRPTDETLALRVEEAINSIAKDGTLSSFSKKWFGTNLSTVESK